MSKFRKTAILTALAWGFTLPAIAGDDSAATKANSATNPQSPTQVMDSAVTPGKSDEAVKRSEKHPPTAVMDNAMPAEKSPGVGADASGQTGATTPDASVSGAGSSAPSSDAASTPSTGAAGQGTSGADQPAAPQSPTKSMDSATPTSQSSSDVPSSKKHPPTEQMDKAVSPQKTPE